VTIVHPWESGADDSPRWDHWSGGSWALARWYERKGELVSSIERSPAGSPIANADFGAAPAGFNALLAFNARELASVTGDGDLVRSAAELEGALDQRWDEGLGTWVDAGPSEDTSGRTRTLEALLPLLGTSDASRVDRVINDLLDPSAYGAPFGPSGVHRAEPVYGADTYWRGPAWPQLSYLVWVATVRLGRSAAAEVLGDALVRGATRSGFAEYWNADSADGLGARPQSWATLALLVH
jgi:glycogen debranching enzyme